MKIHRLCFLVAVGIFVAIACVPSWWQVCVLQWTGLTGLFSCTSVFPGTQTDNAFWQKAARDFPNDVAVQKQAIDNQFTDQANGKLPREVFKAYDALIGKYPGNTWLLSYRIRLSIKKFQTDRVGGELSDPNLYANQAAGIPSPEHSKYSKLNFNSQDLRRVMALCQRGRRLEPDNAFYDWALANFYCIAWQDIPAWEALATARHKKHYNEHDLEGVQNEIRAFERALRRPSTWEEKLDRVFNIPLRDVSIGGHYRELARIFSWSGMKAFRCGDMSSALQIWGGMGHIGRLKRLNCAIYYDGLLAFALEDLAYSNARGKHESRPHLSQSERNNNEKRYLIYRNRSIAPFVALAKKYHRFDLAQEAKMSVKERDAFLKQGVKDSLAQTSANLVFGSTSYAEMQKSWYLWLAGILLLLPAIAALPTLIAVCLTWKLRPLRNILVPSLTRSDAFLSTLSWLGIPALCCTLFVGSLSFAGFTLGAMALGNPVDYLWNGLQTVVNEHASTNAALWPVALSLALLCICSALGRAVRWQDNRACEVVPLRRRFRDFFNPALFNLTYFAKALFLWVATAFFTASCLLWAYWSGGASAIYPIISAGIFGGMLLGVQGARLLRRPRRREALRYALQQISVGACYGSCVAGVLYLAVLIYSMPLREHITHDIDHRINYGDMPLRSLK